MGSRILSLTVLSLISLQANAQVVIKPEWANPTKTLPYQPFAMKDEKTGKDLKPDDMVTLGDGRKVKAKDYYQNLNDNEKYLTSRGYTLRDKKPNLGVVAPVKDTEGLKAEQLKKIKELMVKPSGGLTSRPLPAPILIDGGATGTPVSNNKCKEGDAGAADSRTFNPILGNRGTAALTATLVGSYQANCEGINGTAFADVKGTLVNNDIAIAQARVTGRVTKTGDATIDTDVFIAGKKVFDLDQSKALALQVERTFSQSVQTSFSARGFAGPIPISFTLGAQGSANLIFSFRAQATSATARVTPQVKANAFAEGAVDIFVARAGIGASLLIVDMNSPVTFTATLSVVNNRFQVSGSCEATSALRSLDGRVFLFGELNLIFFRPRFEADLARFTGFQINGPAFQVSSSKDLTLLGLRPFPGGLTPINPVIIRGGQL